MQMQAITWYILLVFIGVLPTFIALYKKKNEIEISTYLVFYLFTTCITWIGEFVVLGIFNGYAYMPGVYTDTWAENITAHLILNSTIYPAAAILMVVYSFRYIGNLFIVTFFVLAEFVFVELGLYEQHWWRYSMSAIIIVIFLTVSKNWFVPLKQKDQGIKRTIIFFFVAFVIIHLPIPLLLLYHKQYYHLDVVYKWVGNLYRSSTIIIFVYQLLEALILVYCVCIRKKLFWKLLPFALAVFQNFMMSQLGVLVFQNGWNLYYTILIYFLCIALFILIEKYTIRNRMSCD